MYPAMRLMLHTVVKYLALFGGGLHHPDFAFSEGRVTLDMSPRRPTARHHGCAMAILYRRLGTRRVRHDTDLTPHDDLVGWHVAACEKPNANGHLPVRCLEKKIRILSN